MGMSSWSGSGSEGYTTNVGGGGLNPWIGWGITTLLLFFLNRKSSPSNTNNQQPSKFTEDNVNCIGQPVPVVLGRCLIKNPLISYYGDFNSEPYTEEYGAWSELDIGPMVIALIMQVISMVMIADQHPVVVATPLGPGQGYALDVSNGIKDQMMMEAVMQIIIWLLMMLINNHLLRTTIQKGFLYYLGWQHIICWTGKNTGVKHLYMNVYDSGMEPIEIPSDDLNPYEFVIPEESVFISTALFANKLDNTNVDAAWGHFTKYTGYYDLHGYATSDDVKSLQMLDDFYATSTTEVLEAIDKLEDATGCIILLQGSGASALGKDFYEAIYEKRGLVVWQFDTLPLTLIDLNTISDEDFMDYFDPSLDSDADKEIANWLNSGQDEIKFYLDTRQLILNSLIQVRDTEFTGFTLGQLYAKFLMPNNTKPYYHQISNTDYFEDTELQCPLDFYWALDHLIEMHHFPSTLVKKSVSVNDIILWEKEHMQGMDIDIDDNDMFGGYDEGGGFIGRLTYYFGNRTQPKDPWMIKSMQAETIEEELRGLTPQYPMYLTCVISNKEKTGGAYIGKQATIPEMWFEVLNYASRLGDYWKKELLRQYIDELKEEYKKPVAYLKGQSPAVQEYMEKVMNQLEEALNSYQDAAQEYLQTPTWDEYIDTIPDWGQAGLYTVGTIIKYSGSRYVCLVEHTSDDFGEDLAAGYWKILPQTEFTSWEENKDYTIGDVVEHLGQIYTCTFDSQPDNVKLTKIDNRKSFYDEDWELFKEDNYPAPSLLNYVYAYAKAAYEYFPPTNREEFGRTIQGLIDLAQSGAWHLGRLDDDLNPAEAIYEILVNDYWGCNYTDDRIDVASLIKLGAVCEREHLGVSCLINRTSQANDYITKILNHINGVKYDNPTTGKLTFKLIRNDYDVDNIKTFDVSNTESCEFSRLDWSETTSAVEVSFTDASNKYETGQFTFTDVSNRLITGFYTSKSVDGNYFTTTANVKWLAQMNQLANGYPLSAINLVTNRYAYDVTIGDPIKVSWEPYGLSQVVYRVTDIDYATLTDGKISITGIEDVYGFDKLDFDVSESPSWTDPEENPTNITRYLIMEDAYEMSHSLDTYMYAYAAKPSSDVIYWNVWRNIGGSYAKSTKSNAWSTVGRLTYGYLKEFGIDENGFEFSILGSGGSDLIENKIEKIDTFPTTYTNTSGLNLVIVDNEIMSYDSIEKLPNGHYQLKGVIRGIFDTLPAQHTAESIAFFVESRQNVAGAIRTVALEGQPPVTEQLELRTETLNVEQPFDVALVKSYSTTRRSEQPSVMANMQFGADMGSETVYQYDYTADTIFSGDLSFTFLGRNKFNNYGIISQLDTLSTITVPSDVKNVIKTRANSLDGEWKFDAYDTELYKNIEEATLTWAKFCERMGSMLRDSNSVLLDVLTYNETKQLYSYDKYEKTINWKVPRFVGVVSSDADAQALADSYINVTDSIILVPETTVSPEMSLLTTECPLLIGGVMISGTPSAHDIICQDGNYYRLNNKAYRIVGWDENNKAIIYPFDITEHYVIRSDFTQLVGNYPVYYQYDGDNYNSIEISTDA